MKFEHTLTSNWENAVRGLRHPMESYDRSDSEFGFTDFLEKEDVVVRRSHGLYETIKIGPNDMDLAQRMIKAGTPNDKFLRQIFVSVDITAPLYWWKEADQYRVGCTTNSTSTMHKLASTPITIDCFEMDDFTNIPCHNWHDHRDRALYDAWQDWIKSMENLRQAYNETKDMRYWKELIRILPESWLQTRTWTANYAVLRNIIHWRRGHKLSEWGSFIEHLRTLPYAEELLFYCQQFDN